MFAGYLRDVTARKRGEESMRRLAAIVEHSNDAIVGVDLRRARSWPGTRAPSALYGWTAEEAIGPAHRRHRARRPRRARPTSSCASWPRAAPITNHRTVRHAQGRQPRRRLAHALADLRRRRRGRSGWPGSSATSPRSCEIERERVRLLEQEKKARRRAEELERRASFLAETHTALDSSLDVRRGPEAPRPRSIVPLLADWCAIHMLGGRRLHPAGRRRRTRTREGASSPGSSTDRYPTDPDDPQGVPEVLRTGEPQLYREITDEMLEEGAHDAEHLEIVRGLGLRSAMLVPLRARGQTLGAMTLRRRPSPERLYNEDDLDFASEMARRAALSIDNARLHSELSQRSQELEFLARRERRARRDARPRRDAAAARRPDASRTSATAAWSTCSRSTGDDPAGRDRHRSTETAQAVLERLQEQHIDLDSAHPIAIAMRTGQLQRVEDIDRRAAPRRGPPTSRYLDACASWPGRSAVVAPMLARGRTLGTIALASFTERTFERRRRRG